MERLEKISKEKTYNMNTGKEFNPSYEILEESFGVNTYSADCCRCNPQRC